MSGDTFSPARPSARPVHRGTQRDHRETRPFYPQLFYLQHTLVLSYFPNDPSPHTPQVDASFSHSLLRVVPFDDRPALGIPVNSSPLVTGSVVSADLGRSGQGVGSSGFNGSTIGAGGGGAVVAYDMLTEDVIRGGDVVRLSHLSSAGFLTHESISTFHRDMGEGKPSDGRSRRVRMVRILAYWRTVRAKCVLVFVEMHHFSPGKDGSGIFRS